MLIKEGDLRKPPAAQDGRSKSLHDINKRSHQASGDPKMLQKDNKPARVSQIQGRKRRLGPEKAVPTQGIQGAAQLARNYIRAAETHQQGNQGKSILQGISFPYEQLLQFPVADASSNYFSQDLALINQLHGNGSLPEHMMSTLAMTVNKRPFLAANAAEESRMKRLRKIVSSSTLETLGHQATVAKYGGYHASTLLPSAPGRFFESRDENQNFHFLQKSPSTIYPGDPPSPTPGTAPLNSKPQLDSSAFPSVEKSNTFDRFHDGKEINKDLIASSEQISPQTFNDDFRTAILQLPQNGLSLSQFDGGRHMTTNPPQNHSCQSGNLTSTQLDSRSHPMARHVNGDQQPQRMSDGPYLSHVGHDMQTGLPHFSQPDLASYLGHLAALRSLPQNEGIHIGSVQGQDLSGRPRNPSAGILPLPGTGNNQVNTLPYLPPDAGLLPLPGRLDLAQMPSLQQDLNNAQGFNSSQHSLEQPFQMQGDLAHLRHDFRQHLQSQQMQNHLQYLNQELAAQGFLRSQHARLQPHPSQNDMFLQQELSVHQCNTDNQRLSLQGNLNSIHQELTAQRLQSGDHHSVLHPQHAQMQNELASLQQELLVQRFNASQHPLLHFSPMQGNFALHQQDLATQGLNPGQHPHLQMQFPQLQGELNALQQELDFRRMNGIHHPLMQSLPSRGDLASLQQQLSAQRFNGDQQALLQALHM